MLYIVLFGTHIFFIFLVSISIQSVKTELHRAISFSRIGGDHLVHVVG